MKSKENTSPVRSRDKVLQSLYEIDLGGSDAKEILSEIGMETIFDQLVEQNIIYTKGIVAG